MRRRRGGSKEGKDRFRVHSYRTLEIPIPGLILEMPNDRIEPPPSGGGGGSEMLASPARNWHGCPTSHKPDPPLKCMLSRHSYPRPLDAVIIFDGAPNLLPC